MTMKFARDFGTARGERNSGFQQWHISQAKAVFAEQAQAIARLADQIDDDYARAVELLYSTEGHVIVCGVGKSGLVGRKMAATLASTGTPAFFLHPGEAFHGDLGMVTQRDTVILISYSGETEEIIKLLPHFKRMQVPIVSLVGNKTSTVAAAADVALDCSVEREICPNNLVPTCSTLAAAAMGDALAVSLMHIRDFQPRDFARLHPGGSLGRKLLMRVRDVMHKDNLPIASPEQTVRETLLTMTRGRLGIVIVFDKNKLVGIVTDGDLRRALQKFDDVLDVPLRRFMTRKPLTVNEESLASEAEELMRKNMVKVLIVVNEQGAVSGVLDIFNK